MADTEDRNTPGNAGTPTPDTTSRQPAARKKSRPGKTGVNRGSPAGRRGVMIDRGAPLHQARVLAMQALFEEDLTEHGLEDILQHLGERERRDHGDYHARLRSDARRAIEEIALLARNADLDAPDSTVSRFRAGTDDVLDGLFAVPEAAEGDAADEGVSRLRTGIEGSLKSVLEDYRNGAEQELAQLVTANQVHNHGPSLDRLAKLEAETSRRVEDKLVREERSSREAVMAMMHRTVGLAQGVEANRDSIDPHIVRAAPAFPMPQLASIDRVVLRLAVYELLFKPDVPFKAAINEAVDIAKRYGGPRSGSFVNGVLRTIAEGLPDSRKQQKPRA